MGGIFMAKSKQKVDLDDKIITEIKAYIKRIRRRRKVPGALIRANSVARKSGNCFR